jgi:hypothetical protein
MEYFPSILIPPEIHRAKSAEPPIPQFKELAPTSPGPRPKKIEIAGITFGTWLAFPSVGISTWLGGLNSGVIVLLGAMAMLSIYVWKQLITYPERQRKHEAEVSSYPRKLEAFKLKKQQHQEEVQLAKLLLLMEGGVERKEEGQKRSLHSFSETISLERYTRD